jgi:hypothetical protein
MADVWNVGVASVDTVGNLTATGGMNLTGSVVNIANLPTSDPSVAGQLWANSGVVTVSAG